MTIRARALTTFQGDYGRIITGQIFICEPGYFQHLRSKHMAEEAPPLSALAPQRHQAMIVAPEKKTPQPGGLPTSAGPAPQPSPLAPPIVGPAKPSPASRRGHRSSNRT